MMPIDEAPELTKVVICWLQGKEGFCDEPGHGKGESLCPWAGDRDVRDAEVRHSVHHLDDDLDNDDVPLY